MTPCKQTVLSNPETGILGNCLTACVASILDLPIEEVPHFVKHNDWFAYMWNWLYERGYIIVCPSPAHWESNRHIYPSLDGYIIVWGKSPRHGYHCVIYKDGKPYFDPHPDNTFTTDVTEYCFILPKGDTPNYYDHFKMPESI